MVDIQPTAVGYKLSVTITGPDVKHDMLYIESTERVFSYPNISSLKPKTSRVNLTPLQKNSKLEKDVCMGTVETEACRDDVAPRNLDRNDRVSSISEGSHSTCKNHLIALKFHVSVSRQRSLLETWGDNVHLCPPLQFPDGKLQING